MLGIYVMGAGCTLFFMYKKREYRKYLMILLAGSLLALCIRMKMTAGTEKEPLLEILRQEKTGEKAVIELEAEGEGDKELLKLELGAVSYTRAELEELEEKLWERLEKEIQKENPSLEKITSDLFFPETVEGYPFLLSWSSSDGKIVSQNGKLGEEIPPEGVLAEIQVRITEPESQFEKERVFYVKAFPSKSRNAFWKRLEKHLTETEKASRNLESYRLPGTFEGEKVQFYKKTEDKSSSIFLLSAFATVAMIGAQHEEREKEKKRRLAELEREYPQVAVRMAMLTDTGMTISGAFKRIAADYGRKKPAKSLPLYEEMLVACREMESGISEITAYQNMGRRCQVQGVLRFTALLTQYTKSGAAGLKGVLQEEAREALKERKEYARRKGEEAGTKLLMPMMGMLVLVMIVIMIPAFTSFGM